MYATLEDVRVRSGINFTAEQEVLCKALIEDCAVIIDSFNAKACPERKKLVTCSMVARAIQNANADSTIPVGATQGSMAALGYSQSWTFSGHGSNGELYISKSEKRLLGYGNKIGSSNPLGGC